MSTAWYRHHVDDHQEARRLIERLEPEHQARAWELTSLGLAVLLRDHQLAARARVAVALLRMEIDAQEPPC